MGILGVVGERQEHLKGELFLGFEGRKQRRKVKNKRGGWIGGCEN